MADGRMLAKKISLNEAVASLDNDMHRLLFTWGLSHLDIEGRISGSPKVFRAIVVPLLEHITSEKISKFFKDAESHGLILRYQIEKDWIIEYPKFKDNQRLRTDREAPSKLPPPPDELPTTPGVLPESSGSPPALSLSKDKLSLSEGKEISPPSKKIKKEKTPIPEDFGISETVHAWAQKHGFGQLEEHLAAFKRKVAMNGYTYINWDAAFIEAIREDWAKIRKAGRGAPLPTSIGGKYDGVGTTLDNPD